MAFIPYKYTTPQYGEKAFERAYKDYQTGVSKYGDLIKSAAGDVQTGLEDVRNLSSYYQPGGEFGKGQKTQATQDIQKGLAQSTAQSVAAGQSSMVASRGLNVLAASERAKRMADIEDQRAQLELQSYTPYTQMISSLSNLASTAGRLVTSAPTRGQFVTQGKAYISGYGRPL